MSTKKQETGKAREKAYIKVAKKVVSTFNAEIPSEIQEGTIWVAPNNWNGGHISFLSKKGVGFISKFEHVSVNGFRDGLNVYGYTEAPYHLLKRNLISKREFDLFKLESSKRIEKENLVSALRNLEQLAKKLGYTIQPIKP